MMNWKCLHQNSTKTCTNNSFFPSFSVGWLAWDGGAWDSFPQSPFRPRSHLGWPLGKSKTILQGSQNRPTTILQFCMLRLRINSCAPLRFEVVLMKKQKVVIADGCDAHPTCKGCPLDCTEQIATAQLVGKIRKQHLASANRKDEL